VSGTSLPGLFNPEDKASGVHRIRSC